MPGISKRIIPINTNTDIKIVDTITGKKYSKPLNKSAKVTFFRNLHSNKKNLAFINAPITRLATSLRGKAFSRKLIDKTIKKKKKKLAQFCLNISQHRLRYLPIFT